MKKGIFVTGTDTGVGKTFISGLIVSALKARGLEPSYFKPIQTGTESDTAFIEELTETKFAPPYYSLKAPMSPDRAAELEGVSISIEPILKRWSEVRGPCVVEGAGGLMVPLNKKEKMRDLALALNIPLIIVARTQLGTINHTLLTIESAQKLNLKILGIVLNGPEEKDAGKDPIDKYLTRQTGVPVIATIPPIENLSDVKRLSGEFFPQGVLKELFGELF